MAVAAELAAGPAHPGAVGPFDADAFGDHLAVTSGR